MVMKGRSLGKNQNSYLLAYSLLSIMCSSQKRGSDFFTPKVSGLWLTFLLLMCLVSVPSV